MQEYFSYNNLSISYTKQGSGNAVVLVHGFGEDGSIWDYQTAFLKDFYTVIVIDLPGSGRSKVDSWQLVDDSCEMINDSHKLVTYDSRFKTSDLSTIEFYADCVATLLQHLTITNCNMFGHSMGGYITLAFAENYPELLKGFGLVHSTAFADSD
ncbi:MAG: alpha/beta hydrolase, partial [Pedobacter sp.]|nr:alpha/beta hydrolase [Chitinophagaceae bacterium]